MFALHQWGLCERYKSGLDYKGHRTLGVYSKEIHSVNTSIHRIAIACQLCATNYSVLGIHQ